MSRLRFVAGTLFVYGLASQAAFSNTPLLVPSNIIVDRQLDDIVARMMHHSATFRDQCRHLGSIAPLRVRLVVRIIAVPSGHPVCRADATLRRYQFGRIEALVRLPSRKNAEELIAHELEHVREYVEGTRYATLAARLNTGVWTTGAGHYETARAVAVGRRVAQEVRADIGYE